MCIYIVCACARSFIYSFIRGGVWGYDSNINRFARAKSLFAWSFLHKKGWLFYAMPPFFVYRFTFFLTNIAANNVASIANGRMRMDENSGTGLSWENPMMVLEIKVTPV